VLTTARPRRLGGGTFGEAVAVACDGDIGLGGDHLFPPGDRSRTLKEIEHVGYGRNLADH
jgi:hypothetical protein